MKKLAAIVLALMMAFSLAACGQQNTETPAPDPVGPTGTTNEPAPAAEPYEIAVVVKVVGIDYFSVFEEGVKKFAADHGVNAYVVGPSSADAAEQVNIIEDLIHSGVDAICVVPNDATVLENVLQSAKDKGIVVVTTESPGQVGADFDVEMIINNAFAELIAEDAAQSCGGKGQYALYVGGLTVPLHNAWADRVESYLAEKYPEMTLCTDRIACGEDAALARETTLDLLKTYTDLNCFICFGSQGPIGAAEALTEQDLIGKVVVVGNIIPSEGATYLETGAITTGYLWNPADSGYACCYIAQALLNGEAVDASFRIPGMGEGELDGTTLWIDQPIAIKADNWESFGF